MLGNLEGNISPNWASPTSMDCCSKVSQSLVEENPKTMFSLGHLFYQLVVRVLSSQFLCEFSWQFKWWTWVGFLCKKTTHLILVKGIILQAGFVNNFLVWHHMGSLEDRNLTLPHPYIIFHDIIIIPSWFMYENYGQKKHMVNQNQRT